MTVSKGPKQGLESSWRAEVADAINESAAAWTSFTPNFGGGIVSIVNGWVEGYYKVRPDGWVTLTFHYTYGSSDTFSGSAITFTRPEGTPPPVSGSLTTGYGMVFNRNGGRHPIVATNSGTDFIFRRDGAYITGTNLTSGGSSYCNLRFVLEYLS